MRALLLCVVLAGTLAAADPRPARNTADVGPRGSWSVGVFNPLRLAILDGLELQTHPLVFLVAPNLDARFALVRSSSVRLTAEAGLSLPTFGLRLTKGYLFPAWATSENDIGWMLIPRAGLLLSGNVGPHDVWTLKADGAWRAKLGPNSATQLNSFLAPLDILLAAPLTGSCYRVGGAYDHALSERLRLRGELNLYATGPQGRLAVSETDVGPIAELSPLIVTAHVGLDVAVFKHSRFTVGVLWANADQGATRLVTGPDGFSERERVRGNNIVPTLDFIWAGP
ncbi:hypothetical protein [Cystobacter ferrugineus]|uniref:Uncharacterized protein n=1 Tax=Cystobacter ferrugineus TaxID=83449 RepID=A0A1L9AYV9_9BACT|nr:hypothetical protein [Cystobacter ferrugineus]OJH35192.1 hypothetical protein BON30_39745 [Cystobacter ferrugineus]